MSSSIVAGATSQMPKAPKYKNMFAGWPVRHATSSCNRHTSFSHDLIFYGLSSLSSPMAGTTNTYFETADQTEDKAAD